MPDRRALAELLQATAEGDAAAFEELYRATSAKLYGVVLRILNRRELADEVLQETYLRIWNSAARYRADKGTPMTWMITIARNGALDRRRQYRPERPLDAVEGDDAMSDPAASPLSQAMLSAEARALYQCLERLEAPQRECIVLAFLEGYTHEELAKRFGCPLGTVKSWIRRGLIRTKECLER